MIQALPTQSLINQWVTICPIEQILPNTGVCALVEGQQVAVFRVGDGTEIYALSNYDPFSKAFVLSRGIIGDRNGIPKVASPIYKQNFNLQTGQCLDDETVRIPTFAVRVIEMQVQVSV
ncbi:nitrite reductase (NAD(P)H) small subunit [Phormidesmis priestleyi ULC007]|uniref:Nitrite reductase (NAD(P)H) small subunit n=1 Tax=Phormidesmis priestleyi ULC007 TaxID=1920490 RepID=A0A2T1D7M6_9CYAN|nr:nitrite reductase small subunit NirD [Phormidesmis priestleyi]PSB16488.1 nitrite reductase (NAD(P)H) small subunit [Phormidesmis priestleyi ULC007]PZO48571.1 MAG: nitrite reductase (NAD(P)H) small subunit [Phormidesmis priestleyi]